MPNEANKKKPGSKTWMDILGQRMNKEGDSSADTSDSASRIVRFSDLTPPDEPRTRTRAEQTDLRDSFAFEASAPAQDDGELDKMRKKLKISEDGRKAAEARITELEAEVEALRQLISQGNVHEVEGLRQKLTEAYEIIQAIEQAYLANERNNPGMPGRPK